MAVGLLVGSLVLRVSTIPSDGLFYDDAWVAVAVERSDWSQLGWLSTSHPGFSAILKAAHEVTNGALLDHSWLALLAGTFGPPVTYLVLRRVGYRPVTSAAVAGVLVVNELLRAYSGRVKPYTAEFIFVMVGAALVIPLCRRRWTIRTGAIWVAAVVAVSLVSGVLVIPTAVMGVLVVLTAGRDRLVRGVAVAVQALAQLGCLVVLQRTYDIGALRQVWRDTRNAFLDISANPLAMIGEVFDHHRRVVGSFTNTSGAVAWLATAVLIVGVVLLAVRRRDPLGWYLVGILGVAVVGAFAGLIPFGGEILRHQRVVIWLFPVFAFALAEIIDLVSRGSPRHLALIASAAVAVSFVGGFNTVGYPSPASPPQSWWMVPTWQVTPDAAAFIDASRTANSRVLLPTNSVFSYAANTDEDLVVVDRPGTLRGYRIRFMDRGVRHVADLGSFAGVDRAILFVGTARSKRTEAARTLFHTSDGAGVTVERMTGRLINEGFCPAERTVIGNTVVLVFDRPLPSGPCPAGSGVAQPTGP